MSGAWGRKRVLIVVRTYPTPARKGVEVSCTAGITEQGEWIRLFPVPYRFVAPDKRFQKYQWIDVSTKKASDPRPESFSLDIDSIQIIGTPIPTHDEWSLRRAYVEPLIGHCMCCLKQRLDEAGAPTLGLFKPKEIGQLVIEPDRPNWTPKELARLRQSTIFEHTPTTELEKIPFKFSYRYVCDHAGCAGHKMMCTDWEMGQSYRKWRSQYGDSWGAKFRQRYEEEMVELNDTHLYVGTVREHPREWIVIGLWYPRRTKREGRQGVLV